MMVTAEWTINFFILFPVPEEGYGESKSLVLIQGQPITKQNEKEGEMKNVPVIFTVSHNERVNMIHK